MDETIAAKVTHDMAAYARSVAERRGRNGEWAEQAVRESISATESEALEAGVIDLIAADLEDLVRQIDQREIPGKGKLTLQEAQIIEIQEDLRSKVLRVIADPNVAFILFMLGLAGIYFELSHPGTVFPGVVGAIALVLAFFAFQTLPINFTGMLLIGLALIFFILEMKITSYGLLSIAGIVALLLGSLMLFKGAEEGLRPSLTVILPTLLVVAGFFVALAGLVYKAQAGRPRTGGEGLVGEIGVARTALDPQGKVFVHGELWNAKAADPIPAGSAVEVTAVNNLTLVVVALKDV
jgi:membrane-bound serine protease (ClpP class)